jgi:hypothetical protein
MAMGTRQSEQASLWVANAELPKSPGHPFYARLNALLDAADFDRFVEGQCARFYAVASQNLIHAKSKLPESRAIAALVTPELRAVITRGRDPASTKTRSLAALAASLRTHGISDPPAELNVSAPPED